MADSDEVGLVHENLCPVRVFVLSKICKLGGKFTANFKTSPTQILNYSIKPNINNFQFKLITDKGVKQSIKHAKSTN